MTTFHIKGSDVERWMRQNQAEYTGVLIEACLLDNFVLVCKRGFAAFYEHCLNEWTSNYLVEFEPGAAQNVWKRWYEFEERNGERCL